MNTVDLQQIGRMAEAVERNSRAVEKLGESLEAHAAKVEASIEKTNKRIDDHMDKEEAERKEMFKLIESVAKDSAASDVNMNNRLSRLEWRLGLIAATLGAGGYAVGPFIGRLIETAFLDDMMAAVITYLPW